jgi:CheY-like chemotaxis protein
MMPDVSGMDVYAALQANDPRLAARMVFVTGGAFSDDTRAFLDRVDNQHIEKPVGVGELRAFVQRWLSDR